MNLKQLPYFIAIAETGSLSAAARQAEVSQPAISGYLQDLERELGTPLFVRSHRRMVPTEAGTVYLDMARQVLDLQARTHTMILARHNPRRQTISIGLSPHRGAQVLAAIYQPFNQRFPQTEIKPVENYAQGFGEMLEAGKLNLAFSTAAHPFSPDVFRFLPTQQEEIVLALPAFHPLAAQASREISQASRMPLKEFRDTPFVLMAPNTTVGQVSQQMFVQSNFLPVVVFQSSNVVMVKDMIRSGAGAGLIPAFYATPHPDVVYFRLTQPGFLAACAVWCRQHALTEAERYLIYLKARLWDQKAPHSLTKFLWTEDLRQIFQEFEPDYPDFPELKGGEQ